MTRRSAVKDYNLGALMLSEDVLFGLMENSLDPSEDLISYLLDVPEKKTLFEEQFRKWLHSSNLKVEDAKILIKVYETQAKKYYEKHSQAAEVIIASNPEDEKKKQEIAKITPTDITDVVIHKNYQFDLFALEFPLFSLKLDKRALDYEFTSRNGTTITLRSTMAGRATIQDADLWLYCISKMLQLIYEKDVPTRRITFTGYDFLKKTGRKPTGSNYQQIIKSLERLKGTILKTNRTIETWEVGAGLGLLDSYDYIKDKKTGKIVKIEVVLPEWLYCEIVTKKIATINPQYLKLKPLEKRIYQIAKIHCRQESFNNVFNLNYFAKKVGSVHKIERFRFEIKKLCETQPLPDFLIHYNRKEDKVWFTLRGQTTHDNSKIEGKEFRENVLEKLTEKFTINEDADSVKKKVNCALKALERMYPQKKHAIFKTDILTEKKLFSYIKEFGVNLLFNVIEQKADFDFSKVSDPGAYFWGILENARK